MAQQQAVGRGLHQPGGVPGGGDAAVGVGRAARALHRDRAGAVDTGVQAHLRRRRRSSAARGRRAREAGRQQRGPGGGLPVPLRLVAAGAVDVPLQCFCGDHDFAAQQLRVVGAPGPARLVGGVDGHAHHVPGAVHAQAAAVAADVAAAVGPDGARGGSRQQRGAGEGTSGGAAPHFGGSTFSGCCAAASSLRCSIASVIGSVLRASNSAASKATAIVAISCAASLPLTIARAPT